MSKPNSILLDLRNYMGGRIGVLLLSFASFPILTRVLTASQYGIVSLALRITLIMVVFSKCGFQYSVNRFYQEAMAEGTDASHRRYYSTLVFCPTLIALTLALACSIALVMLSSHIEDPLLRQCILVVPWLGLVRVLQSILLGFLRNEGKSRLHSGLEIVSKLLTLIALLAIALTHYEKAIAFLLCCLLSETSIVCLQLYPLMRRHLLRLSDIDWPLARNAFSFGLPLILYELASIVLDSGDRILVQHFSGDQQLGYYSAACNVSSYFQDTMMMPMNLAFLPLYMRLWATEGPIATSRFLSQALNWFLVAIAGVTSLVGLCSEPAIVLLASRRFLEASHLLPILVPAIMLYSTHVFLNAGMIIAKKTRLMALMVCGAAIVNIGANLFVIPRFGIRGASWTTLGSYAFLIGMMAIRNQSILPLRLDLPLLLQATGAAGLAYAAARSLHAANPLLALAGRGIVGLLLFVALLLLMSRKTRQLLTTHAWRRSGAETCVAGT